MSLYLVAGFLVAIIIIWRLIRSSRSVEHLPLRFVVIDTETTGLSSDRDRLIEIAAIKVNRESDNHITFHSLINPKISLPHTIVQMTGITDEMLECGDELEETNVEFCDFIEDLPLVFYNAKFDMEFLTKAAGRMGYLIDNEVEDALSAGRQAFPGLRSYKLVDVAKHLNLGDKQVHRALEDAALTLQVYSQAKFVLHQARNAF